MSLTQGYSQKSVSKNIKTSLKHGKKPERAVALALETAKHAMKKAKKA